LISSDVEIADADDAFDQRVSDYEEHGRILD
jgi:hypothetical protein